MDNIKNDKYSYTDEERFKIFKQQYENNVLNKPIMINEGSEFVGYVSHIVDDSKGSGLQEYVITDNYVPINASYEERLGVKDVTILYRGSTSLGEGKNSLVKILKGEGTQEDVGVVKDTYNDWVINNLKIGVTSTVPAVLKEDGLTWSILQNRGTSTKQMRRTIQELQNIEKAYPNAKIWIYGHSQSNANLQKAVVNMSDPERLAGA